MVKSKKNRKQNINISIIDNKNNYGNMNKYNPNIYNDLLNIHFMDLTDIEVKNYVKDPDELFDNYMLFMYYSQYKKKGLKHIIQYYSISNTRKKKDDIIHDIIDYENDINNIHMVQQRKLLWEYMNEINNDDYLSSFLKIDLN